MECSIILNSAGLLCDITGAILLFKFGLPENISKKGHINLILEQIDENEKRKAKKYDLWGKIGLILIIIGFVFQLLSSFV